MVKLGREHEKPESGSQGESTELELTKPRDGAESRRSLRALFVCYELKSPGAGSSDDAHRSLVARPTAWFGLSDASIRPFPPGFLPLRRLVVRPGCLARLRPVVVTGADVNSV